MKYFLFSIFYFLFSIFSIGQTTFNKKYDFSNRPDNGFNVLETDSGYLIMGAADINGANAFGVVETDFSGAFFFKKIYSNDSVTFPGFTSNSAIQTKDGGYIATSQIWENNKSAGYLFKFDANVDSLWFRIYEKDSLLFFSNCQQTADGGYIITGVSDQNDWLGQVILMKTDSLGNIEWEKEYGVIGQKEQSRSLAITPDGGYIIGAFIVEDITTGVTDGLLIKTDSLGNELWSKTVGVINKRDCPNKVIISSDGGIMVIGCEEMLTSDNFVRSFVSKYSQQGTLLWKRLYGDSSISSNPSVIKELADGSFVTIAQSQLDGENIFGSFYKIDKFGNPQWYRRHTYADSISNFVQSYVRDFKVTQDGGFIATGFVTGFIPGGNYQDMWLLKLDSMGCLVAGCDTIKEDNTTAVQEVNLIQSVAVSVFPNPTQESFTIQGEYQLPAQFMLYDIQGKHFISKTITQNSQIIDVSNLPTGTYSYSLQDAQGAIGSGKLIINKE